MKRILILILIAGSASAAQPACLGKIIAASSPSNLSYSPFAAQDGSQAITVTIQNTAGKPCSYQLSIPSASYPLRLGGKLTFAITQAGAGRAAKYCALYACHRAGSTRTIL